MIQNRNSYVAGFIKQDDESYTAEVLAKGVHDETSLGTGR